MKSTYFDIHQKAMANDTFFVETHYFNNYQVYHLKEQYGKGFVDNSNFKDINIVRSELRLNESTDIERNLPLHYFGINVFLSGSQEVTFSDFNKTYGVTSPMVMLRQGNLGNVGIKLPANENLIMLSIDFDKSLIDDLVGKEYESPILDFFRQTNNRVKILSELEKDFLHHANYLFHLPIAQNRLGLIQLEGAVLSLLAILLQHKQDANVCHKERAINDAIHILTQEYRQTITIRKLSQRVGLNECDLKRLFKIKTGDSIAKYALKCRMLKASELLALDWTPSQVAEYLGFKNTYYFKQTYTKHFAYNL